MKQKISIWSIFGLLIISCNSVTSSSIRLGSQTKTNNTEVVFTPKKSSSRFPSFNIGLPKRGIIRTLGKFMSDYTSEILTFGVSFCSMFRYGNSQQSFDVLDLSSKNFSGTILDLAGNGADIAAVSTLQNENTNRLAVSRLYDNGTENHFYLQNGDFSGDAISMTYDGRLVYGGVDNSNNKSILVDRFKNIHTLRENNVEGSVYDMSTFQNDTYVISSYKNGNNPIYGALSKFSGGSEKASTLMKHVGIDIIPKVVKYMASQGVVVSGNALNESFSFVCRYFANNISNKDCHFYDAYRTPISFEDLDENPFGNIGITGTIDDQILILELSKIFKVNFAASIKEKLKVVQAFGWDRLIWLGAAGLFGVIVGTWLSLVTGLCKGQKGADNAIQMVPHTTQIEYSHTDSEVTE